MVQGVRQFFCLNQRNTMDLELAGKVAVVTGASKGYRPFDRYARCRVKARSSWPARAQHPKLGGPFGCYPSSGRSQHCRRPRAAGASARVELHGKVDVLVNNVGAVRLRLEGFMGTSDEEFAWGMNMNFYSALRAMRAAIKQMLTQAGGLHRQRGLRECLLSAERGHHRHGAAKAALVNLSKSLSQEFGPRGIRVNCVSPGPVVTDLWFGTGGVADTVAKATGSDADSARDKVVASIGGFATGRFNHAGRSGRLGGDAGVWSHRQRHRQRIRESMAA